MAETTTYSSSQVGQISCEVFLHMGSIRFNSRKKICLLVDIFPFKVKSQISKNSKGFNSKESSAILKGRNNTYSMMLETGEIINNNIILLYYIYYNYIIIYKDIIVIYNIIVILFILVYLTSTYIYSTFKVDYVDTVAGILRWDNFLPSD
jgi:hypothetical protein